MMNSKQINLLFMFTFGAEMHEKQNDDCALLSLEFFAICQTQMYQRTDVSGKSMWICFLIVIISCSQDL